MKRISLFLLIPLAITLINLAPQEVLGQGSPKKGGTINVGINTDVIALDPHINAAVVSAIVLHHVFESLLGYGENLEILPVAAERWEVSKDFKTYTFYLLKGKTFHNGREMTAEDVKYSLERIMDPKTNSPRMSSFKSVEKIGVRDKYTVVVHLKTANAAFPHILADLYPVIAIVPKEEIEKQGGVFKSPVGTGPFKFVEWKPDRHVILERYDKYVGPKGPRNGIGGERVAYVDRVKFIPIPEESVSVMALLNKEIDILQYFPPTYVDRHKSEYSKKGISLQEVTGLSWYLIYIGVTKPVVSSLKFRQACAYAIDLNMVTQAAYKGHAKANPSVVPEQSQYWTPYHKTWYKKDVNKARQLLKEAGYKGEEVTIDTTKKYFAMYSQAVAVQSELAAVGINVKLNVIDWAVLQQRGVAGDFQMSSYGMGPMPNPGLAYSYLKRTKIDQAYPRINEILEECTRISDMKNLQRLYEELHKIQVEQVPWIHLYNYNYLQAYHNYVKGYQANNTGYPRLWGVWLDK